MATRPSKPKHDEEEGGDSSQSRRPRTRSTASLFPSFVRFFVIHKFKTISIFLVLLILANLLLLSLSRKQGQEVQVLKTEKHDQRGKWVQTEPDEEIEEEEDTRVPLRLKNQFTMIMNTYHRQDLFKETVESYCNIPELHEVLVIWNNEPDLYPLPEADSFRCSKPVKILPQVENQVINRLLQSSIVKTDAVFQIDDDLLIDPNDVRLAFSVWKGNRNRIIGFQGRSHYYQDWWFAKGWRYSFDSRNGITIVTGAAQFIHKRFHSMFGNSTDPIFSTLKNYSVLKRCCDDIIMNSIASATTGLGPILVDAPTHTRTTKTSGGFMGKSMKPGWSRLRSEAVGDVIGIWGKDPFVKDDIVVSRRSQSYLTWFLLHGWVKDWFFWITNK